MLNIDFHKVKFVIIIQKQKAANKKFCSFLLLKRYFLFI